MLEQTTEIVSQREIINEDPPLSLHENIEATGICEYLNSCLITTNPSPQTISYGVGETIQFHGKEFIVVDIDSTEGFYVLSEYRNGSLKFVPFESIRNGGRKKMDHDSLSNQQQIFSIIQDQEFLLIEQLIKSYFSECQSLLSDTLPLYQKLSKKSKDATVDDHCGHFTTSMSKVISLKRLNCFLKLVLKRIEIQGKCSLDQELFSTIISLALQPISYSASNNFSTQPKRSCIYSSLSSLIQIKMREYCKLQEEEEEEEKKDDSVKEELDETNTKVDMGPETDSLNGLEFDDSLPKSCDFEQEEEEDVTTSGYYDIEVILSSTSLTIPSYLDFWYDFENMYVGTNQFSSSPSSQQSLSSSSSSLSSNHKTKLLPFLPLFLTPDNLVSTTNEKDISKEQGCDESNLRQMIASHLHSIRGLPEDQFGNRDHDNYGENLEGDLSMFIDTIQFFIDSVIENDSIDVPIPPRSNQEEDQEMESKIRNETNSLLNFVSTVATQNLWHRKQHQTQSNTLKNTNDDCFSLESNYYPPVPSFMSSNDDVQHDQFYKSIGNSLTIMGYSVLCERKEIIEVSRQLFCGVCRLYPEMINEKVIDEKQLLSFLKILSVQNSVENDDDTSSKPKASDDLEMLFQTLVLSEYGSALLSKVFHIALCEYFSHILLQKHVTSQLYTKGAFVDLDSEELRRKVGSEGERLWSPLLLSSNMYEIFERSLSNHEFSLHEDTLQLFLHSNSRIIQECIEKNEKLCYIRNRVLTLYLNTTILSDGEKLRDEIPLSFPLGLLRSIQEQLSTEFLYWRPFWSQLTRSSVGLLFSLRSIVFSRNCDYSRIENEEKKEEEEERNSIISSLQPRLIYGMKDASCLDIVWGNVSSDLVVDLTYELQIILMIDSDESFEQTISSWETVYVGKFPFFSISKSSFLPLQRYGFRVRYYNHENVCSNWGLAEIWRAPHFPLFSFNHVLAQSLSEKAFEFSSDHMETVHKLQDVWTTCLGNIGFSTGSHYWEIDIISSVSSYLFIGIAKTGVDLEGFLGGDAHGWGYIGDGGIYHGRTKVKNYGSGYSAGDKIGVLLDCDAGSVSFYKNGRGMGVALENLHGLFYPAISLYAKGQVVRISYKEGSSHLHSSSYPISSKTFFMEDYMNKLHNFTTAQMLIHHLCKKSSSSMGENPDFPIEVSHMFFQFYLQWKGGINTRRVVLPDERIQYISTEETALSQYFKLQYGDRVKSSRGSLTFIGSDELSVWFSNSDTISDNLKESADSQDFRYHSWQILQEREENDQYFQSVSHYNLKDGNKDDSKKDEDSLKSLIINDLDTFHKILSEVCSLQSIQLFVQKINAFAEKHQMSPLDLKIQHIQEMDFIKTSSSFSFQLDSLSNLLPNDTKENSILSLKIIIVCIILQMNILLSTTFLSFSSLESLDYISFGSMIECLPKIIFPSLKRDLILLLVNELSTKARRNEDDYDYPPSLPSISLNRAAAKVSHDQSSPCNLLFSQLYRELYIHSPPLLRYGYTHPMDDGQPRTFKVKFEGEGVDDYGGPYREVFTSISHELAMLRRSDCVKDGCIINLLTPTPNWVNGVGEERESFIFVKNPTDLQRKHLFFLGQYFGIALRSNICLDIPLSKIIWRRLSKSSSSSSFDGGKNFQLLVEDVRSFDQKSTEFVISWIQYVESGLEKEDLEDLWSSFVHNVSSSSDFDFGVQNPRKFATQWLKELFEEYETSIQIVREGISTIIPECILDWCDENELKKMFCGDSSIDVELLQSVTDYEEVNKNDEHVQYFWNVIKEFSEEEKKLFLTFVWARSTLPPDKSHFRQRFKLMGPPCEEAVKEPDKFLPKAHTCFFSLNLPKYSSQEIMKEKLLYAISNCLTMDADFRLTDQEAQGWEEFT